MSAAIHRRLMALVLLVGVLLTSAGSAVVQARSTGVPAGIGVKLLQGPADSVDNPRAHEYIVDHLTPGTTISRLVGFSNGNAEPATLSFYPAAASIANGAFTVGAGHATNDLASWTTMSPASATLAPGETVPVTVTIAVPADATRGERYAAVLGEQTTQPASGGVATVSRVGIRVYLSVGPGGAPVTTFAIDSMTARREANGMAVVTASVHNTGERAVDLSGDLKLSDGPSSLSAGPFPAQTVATLAPGENGTVTVPVGTDVPVGPWTASLTLRSGVTSVTETAKVVFPSSPGSARPSPAAPPAHSPLWPKAVGAGVVLTAIVALIRKRRKRPLEAAPVATQGWHEPPPSDSVLGSIEDAARPHR